MLISDNLEPYMQKKTTYNSTTLVKLAKFSLASKFLSWTKLSKNYGIADKTECDETESFWKVCTKNLSSFGPRMRKEPTYKIEILVKSAKEITVLEFLSKTRSLKCRTACKKYRVIKQGLFRHPVENSRDLESKMRRMNDVKHDIFGQTGRN